MPIELGEQRAELLLKHTEAAGRQTLPPRAGLAVIGDVVRVDPYADFLGVAQCRATRLFTLFTDPLSQAVDTINPPVAWQ
jgi:hypothetical protein